MTSKEESVTTDIYPRASFGAIKNWGDKKCGGERAYLEDGHAWRLEACKRSHTSPRLAPSGYRVSHLTDCALHMGKRSKGEPWDKGQGSVAAPVPTVTGDLGLRGGTPCPVQAGAIFHLAAWVR